MGFLKKFQDTEKEATVKAFKADGLRMLPMEHKSEMQLLREENEWLKMVLKDCEKKHVDEKSGRIVDMTRPQPCDMFDVAGDAAEGWLDNLTPAEVELLGERLTRVFRRWARECGEEPDFGEVNHIKRYDLRTGRKV